MDEPPRRGDPLAAAVLAGALVLLAALVAYTVFFVDRPAGPGGRGLLASLGERLRGAIQGDSPPAATAPVSHRRLPPVLPKTGAPAGTSRIPASLVPEAGRTWIYAVIVEPPIWRDITLRYRTERESRALVVQTEFRYAGGQMAFRLGTYAAGHGSHANVRFPGFFFHAAYLDFPLHPGKRMAWGWPWQLPNGGVGAGRDKRYDARVLRWEEVTVPAGTFPAAVIEADLSYVEDGKLRARAKETLWYAPKVFQVVKVVREGAAPDEGSRRIVAELAEFH